MTSIENAAADYHKYDKGSTFSNIKATMGQNVIFWFVPINKYKN